jgi:acetoin utilization deacetylase AcuC-like enzyme
VKSYFQISNTSQKVAYSITLFIMSPPLLVVSRYLPEDIPSSTEGTPELTEHETKDDSMDKFNHPRLRRGLILHELKKRQQNTDSNAIEFVKPDTASPNDGLKVYENVQSSGLIDFLSTAWEQWDAMGPDGQDPFASMAALSSGTPPLVPGNVPLPREPYQRPSKNVMGKIGYYCTDTCTPIFANLKEELLWDVAVMQQAIDRVQAYKTVYALATHPGHHAAQDSFGGYCYLNHAAFAARKLQSQYGYAKVAVLDVDYVRMDLLVTPEENVTQSHKSYFLTSFLFWCCVFGWTLTEIHSIAATAPHPFFMRILRC